MKFEAYRISRQNYQLYEIEHNQRRWTASFNGLQTLLNHYIFCHNLTYDNIMFTGTKMDTDETEELQKNIKEWMINSDRH